jgi:hypothetical protein
MIIRHYGHLAPDYQDEAAEMIGRSRRRTATPTVSPPIPVKKTATKMNKGR